MTGSRSPKEIPPSEEAVLDGEAGSLGARVEPQFAVDRAKVPVYGAGLMKSFSATSALVSPVATRRRTSISLALSPAG
jgi:hypothetical protein